MPEVLGGHAIHGLVYDRPWTVIGEAALSICFDERWPFGGSAQQSFELTPSSLTIRIAITNDERPMPAVAGFHPWFRRVAFGRDAHLTFNASRRYRRDASGIPTRLTTDLGSRPWDDSFVGVRTPPFLRWGDALEFVIDSQAEHWIVCETDRRAICVEPLSGPVNGLGLATCKIAGPNEPLEHVMRLRWGTPSPRVPGTTP